LTKLNDKEISNIIKDAHTLGVQGHDQSYAVTKIMSQLKKVKKEND